MFTWLLLWIEHFARFCAETQISLARQRMLALQSTHSLCQEFPMVSRLLLAAVILSAPLLVGCGNPAGKLVGKWESDMSGVQSQIEGTGNPLAGALAAMMTALKIEAEFKADGTCSIGGSAFGQSNSAGAKWRYVKSEGNVLVLMIKPDQSGDEKELRVTFTDNDHMEMVSQNPTASGQKMPFKRVVTK